MAHILIMEIALHLNPKVSNRIDATRSLIVRLPNWVGDAVMTLPALQAIQSAGISLILLGKPWIKDLFESTGMELLSLEKEFWDSRNKIKQVPTIKTLLFTNSFSSALMARLAGKESIGYNTDMRQLLLKTGLNKPSQLHEVEYFWNLSHFAMHTWFPEVVWPDTIPLKIELPINQSIMTNAQEIIRGAGIEGRFWVLCPFAHGRSPDKKSKIWPYWRDLSQKLSNHKLVVCPGANELDLCQELVPEATVLSGLNLSEYTGVLSLAEQVIANDSGPMHVASAVNANTLGIFGVTDPVRTSPWNAPYIGRKNEWPSINEVCSLVACNRDSDG